MSVSLATRYPLSVPLSHAPRRIAVLRALQLGDLLVAVPALRALRSQFRDAEITLIGLPWAASFAQRFSCYIDRFVEFEGYPGIAEVECEPERVQRFLTAQQSYGYDLVLQMHGSGRTSNPCALALGGQVTVGYYEDVPPQGLLLAEPYPHEQHEIYRNLGIAALVGCAKRDTRLEFPLFEEDHAQAAVLLRQLARADRPWIGIHAGARPPARRWSPAAFAAVADALASRFQAQILLTGGTAELSIVQEVTARMHAPVVNLAGQTSLGALAALISKLDLFISNDTGPAHIACAVDTPSIILFGPADYRRWSPLDAERHKVIRHAVACSPCGYWECPIDHRCLRGITPQEVIAQADSMLKAQFVTPRPWHPQGMPLHVQMEPTREHHEM